MELGLSDSERLLRDAARSFMEREADRRRLVDLQDSPSGYDPRWLATMAEAGWLGLLAPAAAGGGAASALEAALVFEEFGRGPLPGPFFSSSVLATVLLRDSEPSDRLIDTLAGIASGRLIVAVALMEPNRSWRGLDGIGLVLDGESGATTLSGTKVFVPYAAAATHLLVGVRLGPESPDIGFALVPTDAPGVTLHRLPGFVAWSYVVELRSVRVSGADLFRPPEDPGFLGDVPPTALAVLSAYQAGGCAALLDLSVEYSQTRVQFGVPIGRFQRVQDHIVRIVNALDTARWSTYEAVWKIDVGREAVAEAHMAKTLASEAYFEAANAAHEVHAGIGSDPKFGLTLFTQMSRTLYDYLGSPGWHRRQMVDALGWSSTAEAPPF